MRTIRDLVLRCLRRLGKLPAASEEGTAHSEAWTGLGNLQRLTHRLADARQSPQNAQARQLLDQLR